MMFQFLIAAALGTAVFLADPDPPVVGEGTEGQINPAALALAPGAPAELQLPGGAVLEVVVQLPRQSPDGVPTWLGRPADPELAGTLVTLTGNEATGLHGTVISPAGEFRIAPRGGAWNEVRIERVTPPPDAFKDDVAWSAPTPGATAAAPHALPESSASFEVAADDTPTVLDVLVLYTAGARAGRDPAAWSAFLDNLFAVTNEAHAQSGTKIAFRRVDTRQVTASESMTSFELLDYLRPDSGSFDASAFGQVEGWRVAADAHLVALLRTWQPGQGNCGAAGLPVCGDDPQCYNAGLGYSVTSLGDCTALMLAHELGHNLGSAHEPGMDWPGTYPYAHAHVTPGGVGTVMSRTATTLMGRFSAPQLDCDGHPCGIEEVSDNVRSMQQTRHYIARWITDRSVTLLDFTPSRVVRGNALPLNFTWFGVLTPRFDIDLYRDGVPVASLASAEFLPAGFKLLAIPATQPLGMGYAIRMTVVDRPEVYAESVSFELVEATGTPSRIALETAAVTVPAGATSVRLSVRRLGGTEGVAVVDFATEDGTARAGTHYMPSRGSFAWPDGADDAYDIFVPIIASAARGADRSFSVRLSNPSAGSALGSPAVAVVTITGQGGGGGGGALGPLALVLLCCLAGALRWRRIMRL